MTRYAIELDDGRLITDPDWLSPADVMRSSHGQGVRAMPGRLVQLGTPRRIQRRRVAGWRKPTGALVVTRPSVWGNPFPVTADGRGLFPREDAVRMYRDLVVDRLATFTDNEGSDHTFRASNRPHHPLHVPTVDDIRRELAGRDLVCWCALDVACHADVLLELANAPT